MSTAHKLRLTPAVIGLDLLGAVLLVVGVLNITAGDAGILPSLIAGKSLGWPLLVAGAGLMCVAAFLLIAPLLRSGRKPDIKPTVDRSAR